MDKHYDAKASEAKWYKFWEEGGCFHEEPGEGVPYSVVIPPPNVTGILHMGHGRSARAAEKPELLSHA